jgi:hypothetical protein
LVARGAESGACFWLHRFIIGEQVQSIDRFYLHPPLAVIGVWTCGRPSASVGGHGKAESAREVSRRS